MKGFNIQGHSFVEYRGTFFQLTLHPSGELEVFPTDQLPEGKRVEFNCHTDEVHDSTTWVEITGPTLTVKSESIERKLTQYEYSMTRFVVSSTIRKLSSLFGSALELASAIEYLGLFEGLAQYNMEPEDPQGHGWICLPQDKGPRPDAGAFQGWADPWFTCTVIDGIWYCSLGFGAHWLELGFDTEDGILRRILPDSNPSERLWGTENRVNKVLSYLVQGEDYSLAQIC